MTLLKRTKPITDNINDVVKKRTKPITDNINDVVKKNKADY